MRPGILSNQEDGKDGKNGKNGKKVGRAQRRFNSSALNPILDGRPKYISHVRTGAHNAFIMWFSTSGLNVPKLLLFQLDSRTLIVASNVMAEDVQSRPARMNDWGGLYDLVYRKLLHELDYRVLVDNRHVCGHESLWSLPSRVQILSDQHKLSGIPLHNSCAAFNHMEGELIFSLIDGGGC